MRVSFDVVKLTASKTGNCSICKKRCSRTTEFYQTINPYNTKADGTAKSREDIYSELILAIKEWHKITPNHAKCE